MAGSRGPEMGCASLRGEMDVDEDEGEMDPVGVDCGEVVDRVTRDKGDDRDD